MAKRNLGHLPDHLLRIEEVIEPKHKVCSCGCTEMVKIGEDRSERLDIIPACFQDIVTIRPGFACRRCDGGVLQAAAPARLIEGGLPTEGTLAHAVVSKYADHLPLYCQSQIDARGGVEIDRSTLATWCGKVGFHGACVSSHPRQRCHRPTFLVCTGVGRRTVSADAPRILERRQPAARFLDPQKKLKFAEHACQKDILCTVGAALGRI